MKNFLKISHINGKNHEKGNKTGVINIIYKEKIDCLYNFFPSKISK